MFLCQQGARRTLNPLWIGTQPGATTLLEFPVAWNAAIPGDWHLGPLVPLFLVEELSRNNWQNAHKCVCVSCTHIDTHL